MPSKRIIYRKITARMEEMGFMRNQVCELLGISYGTMHNKLCGITPWIYSEVVMLHDILEYPGTIEDMMTKKDAA